MKRELYKRLAILVSASAIVFLSLVIADAQTSETFDIATFQSPKGWEKDARAESIQFSTEDKKSETFCILTILKSGPGVGSSRENFDAVWKIWVKESVNVSAAPTMQPSSSGEGWTEETGSAPFEKDGLKGAAVLITVSGYGKMMSALILTNSDSYEPAFTAFLNSITLKKPETVQQNGGAVEPIPASGVPVGSLLSVTAYNWKQTQNRKDVGGYAGYSSNTYQFNANGTYNFSRVDFQNHTPKYYLENEEGTYKVTGNTITITPRKARFSSHKINKEDAPLKSGNLGLETMQYSFELMDLHNNGRLSLLLSPVDGNETKRDGGFSFWLNGEKRKTYSYNAVNAAGELVP